MRTGTLSCYVASPEPGTVPGTQWAPNKLIDGNVYCMMICMMNKQNESAMMDVRIMVTCEERMTGKEHKGTRWGL